MALLFFTIHPYSLKFGTDPTPNPLLNTFPSIALGRFLVLPYFLCPPQRPFL